ncbi:TetR/AcrR family transcriptional regulator [Kribbella solani]|uniref:TetR/AcrR family transcriptional regulator n=1 Tax=Kribbella solani TaxID=236067 RepID=UPI0029A9D40B|nr:TetR/AcrR family transcriptional regulator [Kribbella solani]MDX2973111.1 TetR/AcrR family transcriptional regulator [Kribbella solani]MDX3003588.1 TetR/AcrR family transcriptional regulator [Kribbella solani]
MPRSATVNQELRERSRERILTAALETFAAKGYEAASISDITAAAGVSRGLVAYYFGTKEQLAAELLDRWLDGIAALLTLQGTPDERLAAIIDATLLAAATTLPVQRLAITLMMQPTTHAVFARVEQAKTARLTEVEDTLRDIFAARGAPDPATEEMLLRATLEGVTVKLAIYPETFPLEAIRHRLYTSYALPAPSTPLPIRSPAVDRLRAR